MVSIPESVVNITVQFCPSLEVVLSDLVAFMEVFDDLSKLLLSTPEKSGSAADKSTATTMPLLDVDCSNSIIGKSHIEFHGSNYRRRTWRISSPY